MNKKVVFLKYITAGVLCAAMVILLVCASGGCKTSIPVTKTQPDNKDYVLDGDGNQLNRDTVNEMPEGMVFSTCTAAVQDGVSVNTGSVTIHATIEPEAATFKDLKWSVLWAVDFVAPNGGFFADRWGDWDNGKTATDYITVTPVDESDLSTVKVDCLQPFGSQILIKVGSIYYPEVFALCKVDYYAPLEFTGITVIKRYMGPTEDGLGGWYEQQEYGEYLYVDYLWDGKRRDTEDYVTYTIVPECTYGTGTIRERYNTASSTFRYGKEFYALAVPYQNGSDSDEIHYDPDTLYNMFAEEFYNFSINALAITWACLYTKIISTGHIDEFRDDILAAYNSNPNLVFGYVDCTFKSETGKTVSGTVECRFKASTMREILPDERVNI